MSTTSTTTTEPAGVTRLREARERADAHELRGDVDVPNGPRLVAAGDVIHATATGLSIPRTTSLWGGRPPLLLTRGDRIVVDEEMIAAAKDRHGRPGWVALVHDPERQVARWGRVHLAPGEPPADMQPWERGDAQWAEAREEARKAAWAETNPQRRAEALQRVKEVYGAPPTTSTIIATIAGDNDAESQRARIAAASVIGSPQVGPSRSGA